MYKSFIINLLAISAVLALFFLFLARAAAPTVTQGQRPNTNAVEARPPADAIVIKAYPPDAVVIEALPPN